MGRTEEDESNAGFEEIILSQSGYHVIKKFIGFGAPYIECILNGMSWNFVKFSSHHYGVPIIRSLLDTIGTAVGDNSISDLYYLQLFADHTPSLVTNQYGNYVVQQLLDISPQSVTDIVKQSMTRRFSEFAQHKFASNVVERCLQHTLKEQKQGRVDWIAVIIHELLEDAETLINHKFGNYCLQTALTVCMAAVPYSNGGRCELLSLFVRTIGPLLNYLRLNIRKNGKHYCARQQRILELIEERK